MLAKPREMHTNNGLLVEVLASKNQPDQVYSQLLEYITSNTMKGRAPLAGSTINFDRGYLKQHIRRRAKYYHESALRSATEPSHFEIGAIGKQVAIQSAKHLRKFTKLVKKRKLPMVTDEEIDLALVQFMNMCYFSAEPPSVGEKTVARFVHRNVAFGRRGNRHLVELDPFVSRVSSSQCSSYSSRCSFAGHSKERLGTFGSSTLDVGTILSDVHSRTV